MLQPSRQFCSYLFSVRWTKRWQWSWSVSCGEWATATASAHFVGSCSARTVSSLKPPRRKLTCRPGSEEWGTRRGSVNVPPRHTANTAVTAELLPSKCKGQKPLLLCLTRYHRRLQCTIRREAALFAGFALVETITASARLYCAPAMVRSLQADITISKILYIVYYLQEISKYIN